MNILQSLNSVLPNYQIKLPFSKKTLTFNPFKVKDIKNLSIVLQEDNKKLSFVAMINILKSCVSSDKDEISDLCLADAEYLFLQIRSKSVDELLNLIVNDKKIKVSVGDIKYRNNLKEETISISNELSVQLKTPKIKDLLELESFEKEDYIKCCIKTITVKNEIYEVGKFVPEEFENILDNLPVSFMEKSNAFIESEPELYLNVKLAENEDESEVSGILNFFTYQ